MHNAKFAVQGTASKSTLTGLILYNAEFTAHNA